MTCIHGSVRLSTVVHDVFGNGANVTHIWHGSKDEEKEATMRCSVYLRFLTLSLCMLGLTIGGAMASQPAGARDVPLWTDKPSTQLPNVQVPNFAELAEHLRPSVVNMSTTQVVKGQRRSMPRLPFPSPFGERDPFEDFFERFFGGDNPQREYRGRS